MEAKRDVKTVALKLQRGTMKRFAKDEILVVYERKDLSGGVETVVQVKSGSAYVVVGSLAAVKAMIAG